MSERSAQRTQDQINKVWRINTALLKTLEQVRTRSVMRKKLLQHLHAVMVENEHHTHDERIEAARRLLLEHKELL